jgi:hypothetical protein
MPRQSAKTKRRGAAFMRRSAKLLRRARNVWRRVRRWWRPAPRPAKFMMAALVILVLWLGINWIY